MYVDSIYFINHKTKDYFLEGVIKSVNDYFKGIKEQ